ncbi:MAG: DUF4874 domain-containing protein [Ideonella sp.]|nr:DUF4874 domain-containing protein [Ideonella sp.]
MPPTDGGSTAGPSSDAVTASFSPDNSTDFPNPERGWYIYAAYNGGLLASPSTWQSEVGAVKNNSYGAPLTLVFGYTSLANYAGSDITSSALSDLDTNLAYMRTAGTRAIIRFHYGQQHEHAGGQPFAGSHAGTHGADQADPREVSRRHLPPCRPASSVTSANGGSPTTAPAAPMPTASHPSAPCKTPCCPWCPARSPWPRPCLCTQEDWFPTVLSSAAAFSGSNLARTAFHNDCFMASANDQYQFPGTGTVNDFTFNKGCALSAHVHCSPIGVRSYPMVAKPAPAVRSGWPAPAAATTPV